MNSLRLFLVDKLNAAHTLFDTFGGSRTISNTSTSNFTQMTAFDFDHSGQIVSASIQVSAVKLCGFFCRVSRLGYGFVRTPTALVLHLNKF